MGFHLIQESGQLIPADIGIKDGDEVFCTVVGGGAGGENGKASDGATGYTGGESGRGGEGGPYSGSGGGGGGFGAGGGGGNINWYSSTSGLTLSAGMGGGSGAVVQTIIKISDAKKPIPVSIAQRVPAETEGQPTTFGDITAKGGNRRDGGGAPVNVPAGNGTYAGGGGGGFQIGAFVHAKTLRRFGAGSGNPPGEDGVATGGASGGNRRGGPAGGGDSGCDGWTFLHSGGTNSGCVLLIW